MHTKTAKAVAAAAATYFAAEQARLAVLAPSESASLGAAVACIRAAYTLPDAAGGQDQAAQSDAERLARSSAARKALEKACAAPESAEEEEKHSRLAVATERAEELKTQGAI